ncbi:hypothetical protein TSUD_57470 [Trifolium subterraneum]|uniref:Uncharacterized protein n=1 Tax=Trifolium subterraneum TaxID=3900 RepID=A0A2Z6NZT3_TRISU|nr:hypothetical protein TSUD_57470 [Trifolium subterraneum]
MIIQDQRLEAVRNHESREHRTTVTDDVALKLPREEKKTQSLGPGPRDHKMDTETTGPRDLREMELLLDTLHEGTIGYLLIFFHRETITSSPWEHRSSPSYNRNCNSPRSYEEIPQRPFPKRIMKMSLP